MVSDRPVVQKRRKKMNDKIELNDTTIDDECHERIQILCEKCNNPKDLAIIADKFAYLCPRCEYEKSA